MANFKKHAADGQVRSMYHSIHEVGWKAMASLRTHTMLKPAACSPAGVDPSQHRR